MGDHYRLSHKTKSVTVYLYGSKNQAKTGSVDVIIMGY